MFNLMFRAFSLTSVAIFAIMLLKFKWLLLTGSSAWSILAAVLLGLAIVESIYFFFRKKKEENESDKKLDTGILNGVGLGSKSSAV